MATITGSGKFAAIAASATVLDQVFSGGISGLVFGNGTTQYARISNRYITSSGTVIGDALSIDPRHSNGSLYLNFPNLTYVLVKDEYGRERTGYTGSIYVARDCSIVNTWYVSTNYATYNFKCGLLTNVYR